MVDWTFQKIYIYNMFRNIQDTHGRNHVHAHDDSKQHNTAKTSFDPCVQCTKWINQLDLKVYFTPLAVNESKRIRVNYFNKE